MVADKIRTMPTNPQTILMTAACFGVSQIELDMLFHVLAADEIIQALRRLQEDVNFVCIDCVDERRELLVAASRDFLCRGAPIRWIQIWT